MKDEFLNLAGEAKQALRLDIAFLRSLNALATQKLEFPTDFLITAKVSAREKKNGARTVLELWINVPRSKKYANVFQQEHRKNQTISERRTKEDPILKEKEE
ncbi:hypothetical protein HAX54_017864 [Datura stramonium]|uniref:Uncharacterized protein n=1 Tax=Datura stramonium TaxID=4076 RepID=A0ABS8Y564_DATST|nr:hypothetical protein [Datura stramonium]